MLKSSEKALPADKLAAAKERAFKTVGYKKGESFRWRDIDRLMVSKKNPDWGYRWIENDPASVQKRESQGFQIVGDASGIPGDIGTDSDGMTGAKTHNELILMALPMELVQARDHSVQEQTDRQTASIKSELEGGLQDINPDAEVHGKVTIIE